MSADFFFVSKCQQICFSSANVSKLDSRQQTSEDVSITVAFVLEKTRFRHHMSENVSRFEFRQQTSANSFFVSGCQQICLFVSKCQQNDDDAGITSLAPARHRTEMIFASGQREFDLDSRLSVYCRTFLYKYSEQTSYDTLRLRPLGTPYSREYPSRLLVLLYYEQRMDTL